MCVCVGGGGWWGGWGGEEEEGKGFDKDCHEQSDLDLAKIYIYKYWHVEGENWENWVMNL